MNINKDWVWDYNLSVIDTESEGFKKEYIGRVLVKGNLRDINDMGLDTIYKYLPELTIPYQLREYWEWYFSQPDIIIKYEHIEQKPATGFKSPVRSWFIKR